MPPNWWQRNRLTILIATAITTSPCWGGCGVAFVLRQYTVYYVFSEEDRAHQGEGHPSEARKWRATLQSIPNIDALDQRPELPDRVLLVQFRFPNGEWVFGYARDSHTTPIFSGARGGTIVLKDSRGCIRTFYGHVCGQDALTWLTRDAKTLDEFYNMIAPADGSGFTEQIPPP